jgi:hypothetical protein
MFWLYDGFMANIGGIFHHVAQLAHITRVWIPSEDLYEIRGKASDFLLKLPVEFAEKILHQESDIAFPLP